MLRRHLMTHYGITPDEYRAKWNLPKDYPMVEPNYAETRRALAKQIGLGTKGRGGRSEEHTSELQSLMRISYAAYCLKKKIPTSHKTVIRTTELINDIQRT